MNFYCINSRLLSSLHKCVRVFVGTEWGAGSKKPRHVVRPPLQVGWQHYTEEIDFSIRLSRVGGDECGLVLEVAGGGGGGGGHAFWKVSFRGCWAERGELFLLTSLTSDTPGFCWNQITKTLLITSIILMRGCVAGGIKLN